MLPYTAYDIIRAVNHEVDLTRPPAREFHQTVGSETPLGSDDLSGGGGFPVGRSRVGFRRRGGLLAALRALAARPARPHARPVG